MTNYNTSTIKEHWTMIINYSDTDFVYCGLIFKKRSSRIFKFRLDMPGWSDSGQFELVGLNMFEDDLQYKEVFRNEMKMYSERLLKKDRT